MNPITESEEKVIEAAIDEFAEKGLKFTMDDVAKNLRMSKKTLYNIYRNKEEMLLAVADYCFAEIKEHEKRIVEDETLDVTEKIRRIMVVLPERYQNIGLSNLYQLKEKYPSVYKRVEQYLDTDWDATIALLEQGMKEGKIRTISIPLLKTMFESTLEAFFATDVLVKEQMRYEDAMQQLIELIMQGIIM